MQTRTAVADDLEALAVLFDQYRQFYAKPGEPELARAFIGERLRRGDSVILIAQAGDGAPAGFAQLYPSFSSVSAARIYILNDLFVAPAHRRQGVGRQLLLAAREFAAGAGAIRLSLATAADNRPAQALYAYLGWARDEHFHHFHLALA